VLVRVAAQHRLEEGRAGGENDAVRLQPGMAIKNPPKKTPKRKKNTLKKPTKNGLGFFKF
jgi:hypothetical protein